MCHSLSVKQEEGEELYTDCRTNVTLLKEQLQRSAIADSISTLWNMEVIKNIYDIQINFPN